MKTLILFALMALGASAFAGQKCPSCEVKPQPKAVAMMECETCAAAQPCAHCDTLTAKSPDSRERAFWAEATKMQANDKVEHGELMACCAAKLTAGKADACCADKANMAPGAKAPVCDENEHASEGAHHAKKAAKMHAKMAAFKVFAGGQYHMFCCEHMASDARESFRAKGMTVGNVQKVVGKHAL